MFQAHGAIYLPMRQIAFLNSWIFYTLFLCDLPKFLCILHLDLIKLFADPSSMTSFT